ncbi:MAG: hypothetical protein NWQ54_11055, partial [Paraglaciecola sp.]|nr:hypothetical protein [Paraglaciecola sp.]
MGALHKAFHKPFFKPFTNHKIRISVLGRVDLWRMNFVQIQSVLIATTDYRPSGLSQNPATKSKTLWVE